MFSGNLFRVRHGALLAATDHSTTLNEKLSPPFLYHSHRSLQLGGITLLVSEGFAHSAIPREGATIPVRFHRGLRVNALLD